jgi:hypothetical protein
MAYPTWRFQRCPPTQLQTANCKLHIESCELSAGVVEEEGKRKTPAEDIATKVVESARSAIRNLQFAIERGVQIFSLKFGFDP